MFTNNNTPTEIYKDEQLRAALGAFDVTAIVSVLQREHPEKQFTKEIFIKWLSALEQQASAPMENFNEADTSTRIAMLLDSSVANEQAGMLWIKTLLAGNNVNQLLEDPKLRILFCEKAIGFIGTAIARLSRAIRSQAGIDKFSTIDQKQCNMYFHLALGYLAMNWYVNDIRIIEIQTNQLKSFDELISKCLPDAVINQMYLTAIENSTIPIPSQIRNIYLELASKHAVTNVQPEQLLLLQDDVSHKPVIKESHAGRTTKKQQIVSSEMLYNNPVPVTPLKSMSKLHRRVHSYEQPKEPVPPPKFKRPTSI